MRVNNKIEYDYNCYTLSIQEIIRYASIGISTMFILAILFYNHMGIALIVSLAGLYYPFYKRKDLVNKRKEELKYEFKDAIYALSTSLEAGKSIETAFRDAIIELKMIYPEDTSIIKEFNLIIRKLEVNVTIEQALAEFAYRADIEDIKNFVNVFITTKRTGGDSVKIIKYTSQIMNEKLEIVRDIQLTMTQKKLEQLLLSLFIPLILLYLQFVSPDYLSVLYQTGIGRIIMTVSFVFYMISVKLANKIMDIEV